MFADDEDVIKKGFLKKRKYGANEFMKKYSLRYFILTEKFLDWHEYPAGPRKGTIPILNLKSKLLEGSGLVVGSDVTGKQWLLRDDGLNPISSINEWYEAIQEVMDRCHQKDKNSKNSNNFTSNNDARTAITRDLELTNLPHNNQTIVYNNPRTIQPTTQSPMLQNYSAINRLIPPLSVQQRTSSNQYYYAPNVITRQQPAYAPQPPPATTTTTTTITYVQQQQHKQPQTQFFMQNSAPYTRDPYTQMSTSSMQQNLVYPIMQQPQAMHMEPNVNHFNSFNPLNNPVQQSSQATMHYYHQAPIPQPPHYYY